MADLIKTQDEQLDESQPILCMVCDSIILNGKTDTILEHMESKGHKAAMEMAVFCSRESDIK